MGVLSPIGNDLNSFWDALLSGQSGAAPITKFDSTHFKTKFACELKDFEPLNYLEQQEIRRNDLFTQYALVAVQEAIAHAQADLEVLNKKRIGVIWGSGNGGIATFEEQVMEYARGNGIPRFSPYFIPKIIVDIASGVISIKYGLRGINYTTISACASSTTAIMDAFNYIRWGKADMIIAGGSEAAITQSAIGGFSAAKALSTQNDNPKTACKPFDLHRDGFVMGEGAAALILESKEHAEARGARIIAEVAGAGMAADAYHLTATHPEGEGALDGMQAALGDAGISARELDYINVHATATPTGDSSELLAVHRLMGSQKTKVHISATKAMTGHLLGAAGAIEAIACIKSIAEGVIPPTINTTVLDPACDFGFDLCLGKAVVKEVNYAMSNTFGFGGHIATAVFKRYQP